MYLILVLLGVILQNNFVQSSISINNYGLYKASIKSWQYCRGPKVKNLTEWLVLVDSTEQSLNVNLTFTEDTCVVRARVSVYMTDFDTKHKLWEYKFINPCEHIAFKVIVKNLFNIGPHCLFKKGAYPLKVNVTEVSNVFLGRSFFYGNMLFKALAYGKNGNVMCFDCHVLYEKL